MERYFSVKRSSCLGAHKKTITLRVTRMQPRRDNMNNAIDDIRNSCSSVFDPKLNQATAAVEKLNKRMGLLSEMDEDFGHEINENNDYVFYDLQNLGCEERKGASFDMTSLSQLSESISKECGLSIIRTNNSTYRTVPPPTQPIADNIKDFLSIEKAARDRDVITKKQHRLVRCIAWDSRLAQLDSSPSVAVRERGCSTMNRSPPKRI